MLAVAYETVENGYVSLSNLVPPGCSSVLASTFCASEEPASGWLASNFSGLIPQGGRGRDGVGEERGKGNVTVIAHDDRQKNFCLVGEAELAPIYEAEMGKRWLWCYVRPNGGLLHCKFLLLRAPEGLRVVISGNNLCSQWTADRDCMWVQDFGLHGREGGKDSADGHTDHDDLGLLGFGVRLKLFVETLTKCRHEEDRVCMNLRMLDIFQDVDFSTARAALVESMPLDRVDMRGSPLSAKKILKTGWKRLAEAVRQVHMAEGVTVGGGAAGQEGGQEQKVVAPAAADWGSSMLSVHGPARVVEGRTYFQAGSFGDLYPDFLQQMVGAMHGREDVIPPEIEWGDVTAARCLWPSRTSAREMNPCGVLYTLRAIPMRLWHQIPTDAKDRLFFDAPPTEWWVQPILQQSTGILQQSTGLPALETREERLHLAMPSNNSKVYDTHSKVWNPARFLAQDYKPVAHAKTIFTQLPGCGGAVMYVGSHNISKSAWGLRGGKPKGIELGVILRTSCSRVREAWTKRLPCRLPTNSEERRTAADRCYVPASARTGLRELGYSDLQEACKQLAAWLHSVPGGQRGTIIQRGRRWGKRKQDSKGASSSRDGDRTPPRDGEEEDALLGQQDSSLLTKEEEEGGVGWGGGGSVEDEEEEEMELEEELDEVLDEELDEEKGQSRKECVREGVPRTKHECREGGARSAGGLKRAYARGEERERKRERVEERCTNTRAGRAEEMRGSGVGADERGSTREGERNGVVCIDSDSDHDGTSHRVILRKCRGCGGGGGAGSGMGDVGLRSVIDLTGED